MENKACLTEIFVEFSGIAKEFISPRENTAIIYFRKYCISELSWVDFWNKGLHSGAIAGRDGMPELELPLQKDLHRCVELSSQHVLIFMRLTCFGFNSSQSRNFNFKTKWVL